MLRITSMWMGHDDPFGWPHNRGGRQSGPCKEGYANREGTYDGRWIGLYLDQHASHPAMRSCEAEEGTTDIGTERSSTKPGAILGILGGQEPVYPAYCINILTRSTSMPSKYGFETADEKRSRERREETQRKEEKHKTRNEFAAQSETISRNCDPLLEVF